MINGFKIQIAEAYEIEPANTPEESWRTIHTADTAEDAIAFLVEMLNHGPDEFDPDNDWIRAVPV